DPEYHVVLLDSFQIAALITALRLHRTPSEGALLAGIRQPAQRRTGVRSQNSQHAIQVTVIERVAGALQGLVVGEDLLSTRHVAGCTLQFDGVRAESNGDVQPIFQEPYILVPGAEQGFDVGTNPNALLHACALRWRPSAAGRRDWS